MAPRRRRRPWPRGRQRSLPGTASWSRGHAGASLLLKHEQAEAPRRVAASKTAPPPAGLVVLGRNLLVLPRAAVVGARRGGASPTTRAAALEDQGPSREREREGEGRPEAELPGLVGALPRELKRNAPCFSLLPRLLAMREKRELPRLVSAH